jgi:hypothetical protein
MSVPQHLKSLYTPRHAQHVERAATVLPISAQVRVLRDQHVEILQQHIELAHEVAAIDVTKVARYVSAPLLPLVQRAYAAAKALVDAGTPDEAMAAVRRVESGVDTNTDDEYERNVQEARRLIALLVGAVAELKRNADTMTAVLDILGAGELAAKAVVVPEPLPGSNYTQFAN